MVPLSCCVKDQYGEYVNPQKCQTWQMGPPKLASGPSINEALFYDVRIPVFKIVSYGSLFFTEMKLLLSCEHLVLLAVVFTPLMTHKIKDANLSAFW